MAYITYDDYKYSGLTELSETEFNQLLPKAEIVLDGKTNYFYKNNVLSSDNPQRKQAFITSLCLIIEQMSQTGITSEIDVLSLQSLSIGSTALSFKNGAQFSIIPSEAVRLLGSVGLTYAGVNYIRHGKGGKDV